MFTWKLTQKALPTASRLASHILEISSDCPMCNLQSQETEQYFFKLCPNARSIWYGCSMDAVNSQILTYSISTSVEKWISDPKYTNFSEKIATTLWFVWKHRCFVTFEKLNPYQVNLIERIKKFLQSTILGTYYRADNIRRKK